MEKKQVDEVKRLLGSPKKIVIVPHKNPDGDAIGSTLALQHFLSSEGHDSSIIAPNNYPDFLKWLPGEDQILHFDKYPEKAKKQIARADIIFTLDFNQLSRTSEMTESLENAAVTFVMIDHHRQPDDYADIMFSDASASSTCEMVYHFIDQLGKAEKITAEMATCLYVGIMTDTGSFRYPSTTSGTHRVIANLIDKGAQNAVIHQNTFDTNSPDKLQLLGTALKNLKVLKGLRTAYLSLSQKELDAHNFKKGDTEGFVNYGLSLKGIVFAAIFIENKDENIVKISLRSKGDFDVNTFARDHFQGGGHLNAAGGKSDQSLKETLTYFEKTVKNYKNELKSA